MGTYTVGSNGRAVGNISGLSSNLVVYLASRQRGLHAAGGLGSGDQRDDGNGAVGLETASAHCTASRFRPEASKGHASLARSSALRVGSFYLRTHSALYCCPAGHSIR